MGFFYDRVEEAVDVPEPYEEGEQCRVNVTDRTSMHVVTDAQSVDDVEREKRKPAGQKHTCMTSQQRNHVTIHL